MKACAYAYFQFVMKSRARIMLDGGWLVTRAVAAAARAARGLCIICAGRRRRHQSGRSDGQALGFAGRTREAAN